MNPRIEAEYFQTEADYWATRAHTARTEFDRHRFEQARQFAQGRADYYRHHTSTDTDRPCS